MGDEASGYQAWHTTLSSVGLGICAFASNGYCYLPLYDSAIMEINLDGTDRNSTWNTSTYRASCCIAYGPDLYVINSRTISKISLLASGGTNIMDWKTELFSTTAGKAGVVYDTDLYVANGSYIAKISLLDGGSDNRTWKTVSNDAIGLAVYGTHLYVTNGNRISKLSLTDTSGDADTLDWKTVSNRTVGLAVYGTDLYVANTLEPASRSRISKLSLAAGSDDLNWKTGVPNPAGLTVYGVDLYVSGVDSGGTATRLYVIIKMSLNTPSPSPAPTVVPPAAPVVRSMYIMDMQTTNGESGTRGPVTGGNTLKLVVNNGAASSANTTVTFGLASAVSTVTDGVVIVTVPPQQATGVAGPVNVTLKTLGASSTTTYIYVDAATISTVTPNIGPMAGKQSVTINGTDLLNASVTIGGVAATIISVASDGNSLICTAAAGIKDIVVTTPDGSATIVTVDASVAASNAATATSQATTAASQATTAASQTTIVSANATSDAVAALSHDIMMAALNEQLTALTNLIATIDVLTVQCETTPSTITLTIYPGNGQTVDSIYDDLLNGKMSVSINDITQQVTSSNVTKNDDNLTCVFNVTSGEYKVIVFFDGTELLNTFASVP